MFVTPGYAQETRSGRGRSRTEPPRAERIRAGSAAPSRSGRARFRRSIRRPFPSQLLWLAITFGLFYLFLKKVVLPRIGGILEVRRDRIAQDLDQAARLKGEADAAVAAYEQELAEARAKANAIGQEARDGAKAEAEAARKKVEAEPRRRSSPTPKRSIAAIKAAAMREVGAIAEDTAAAIVQRTDRRQGRQGARRRRRQGRSR